MAAHPEISLTFKTWRAWAGQVSYASAASRIYLWVCSVPLPPFVAHEQAKDMELRDSLRQARQAREAQREEAAKTAEKHEVQK